MQRIVYEIKNQKLGGFKVVARQRLLQECGDGLAGLQGTERREGLALEQANLVSWEGIKMQMDIFG